jgi:hypothetical protein
MIARKQVEAFDKKKKTVADFAGRSLKIASAAGGGNVSLETEIERKKERARVKAITNLGRYKFMNFGYWAAVWIHLNQLSGKKTPSPFKDFVDLARRNMTYEKYRKDREQQQTKGEDE